MRKGGGGREGGELVNGGELYRWISEGEVG